LHLFRLWDDYFLPPIVGFICFEHKIGNLRFVLGMESGKMVALRLLWPEQAAFRPTRFFVWFLPKG
jgi:hypothetical protein